MEIEARVEGHGSRQALPQRVLTKGEILSLR